MSLSVTDRVVGAPLMLSSAGRGRLLSRLLPLMLLVLLFGSALSGAAANPSTETAPAGSFVTGQSALPRTDEARFLPERVDPESRQASIQQGSILSASEPSRRKLRGVSKTPLEMLGTTTPVLPSQSRPSLRYRLLSESSSPNQLHWRFPARAPPLL